MQLKLSFAREEKPSGRYAEIPQPNSSHFAFARIEGDTVYPLHTRIKCRDFLNDTLVWGEEGFTYPIYGYEFHGDYDKDKTVFHLTEAPLIAKNIGLFNEMEKELGLTPTEIIPCEEGVVSVGDAWWMSTTVHFSWYTQTLRHLNYKLKKLEDKCQENCINGVGEKFWFLPHALRKLSKLTIKRNAPDKGSMHDLNGFYTLLTNRYVRDKLTYGKQIQALAPELFLGK